MINPTSKPELRIEPKGNYTWKPEAGRTIFYMALVLVIFNQIIPAILGIFGVTVPWSTTNVYIVLSAVLVILHGAVTKGWKRALFGFAVLFIVGFVMEGLGVNYGLIYGPYHYIDALGPRIWGVPFIVPVSWELNMYPAFYLAMYLLPSDLISKATTFWQKTIFVFLVSTVGALFCTAYDLICDPVYCLLTDQWVWHRPGDYMSFVRGGIPLTNYFGWILTGMVGCAVYYLILNSTPKEQHIKSNYLTLWIPLLIYFGAMIWPLAMNISTIHNEALYLSAIFGMGMVMLLVVSKYLFTKFGYRDLEEFKSEKAG